MEISYGIYTAQEFPEQGLRSIIPRITTHIRRCLRCLKQIFYFLYKNPMNQGMPNAVLQLNEVKLEIEQEYKTGSN